MNQKTLKDCENLLNSSHFYQQMLMPGLGHNGFILGSSLGGLFSHGRLSKDCN